MPRISKEMKQIVRERLLASAARHFASAGIDQARIDDISTDAGFAKGTVYNYFSSKEDLFGAVVEEAARRAVDRFEQADPGGNARDRLIALARADVSVLRDNESFTKVLVREAMSFRDTTFPVIEEHMAPFFFEVANILAQGAAAGDIRNDLPPPQLALMFVGMLSLLYIQHWGSGNGWPSLDDIPELAVTAFIDGAATRAREATHE